MEPSFSHKYICMWNDSHRTSTEHRQKTSDFQKGKKISTKLGRTKEKRKEKKKREKEIRTETVPLGGSSKKRKFSAPWEVPTLEGRSARTEGELQGLRGECRNWFTEGKVERDLYRWSVLLPNNP